MTTLEAKKQVSKYGVDESLIEECYLIAEEGLKQGEVAVGCVFVWDKDDGQKEVIAKAHNGTNVSKCALAHAEMECVKHVVKKFPDSYSEVLKQTIVLITLEPCIMCCRMLRMMQVKVVLFGARNDRFGGAGSVYNVDTDERIKCPPLTCAEMLDRDRAIELLKKFYNQGRPLLNLPSE